MKSTRLSERNGIDAGAVAMEYVILTALIVAALVIVLGLLAGEINAFFVAAAGAL